MARILSDTENEVYRSYIADALWVIPNKKVVSKRYTELKSGLVVEQRSADEIVSEVIEKAGLTLV